MLKCQTLHNRGLGAWQGAAILTSLSAVLLARVHTCHITLSLSLSLSHIHTHSHPHTLTPSHTHTHTHSLTHSPTHPHTPTHTHIHTHLLECQPSEYTLLSPVAIVFFAEQRLHRRATCSISNEDIQSSYKSPCLSALPGPGLLCWAVAARALAKPWFS